MSTKASPPEQEDSPNEVPRNGLSEVIKRVEIEAVRLRTSHIHFLATDLPSDWAERVDNFWFTELLSEPGDPMLAVMVGCVAQHWVDSEASPESPRSGPDYDDDSPPEVEVFAQFEVTWQVTDAEDLSSEDLDLFCEVNPIVNVWPFWREYLHSTTGRMGVVPLTLPVKRVASTPASEVRL